MIPGRNVLNAALTVIGSQSIRHYRYLETETNDQGIDVIRYSRGENVRGSVQPVSSATYQDRGLDFRKQYIDVWIGGRKASSVSRAQSGDQITYNGRKWQVTETNNWCVDGWQKITAVEVLEL